MSKLWAIVVGAVVVVLGALAYALGIRRKATTLGDTAKELAESHKKMAAKSSRERVEAARVAANQRILEAESEAERNVEAGASGNLADFVNRLRD